MACDDEIIPLQERIETVGDDADLQEVYDTLLTDGAIHRDAEALVHLDELLARVFADLLVARLVGGGREDAAVVAISACAARHENA
jgi:hypothetical protein